jgi:DNA polymerase-3 subunit delta'
MLIGHQKIWQYLNKLAEQDSLPHALLLSGQEKLGKKTLAIEFTKQIFKEDVMKRQHPDFILVSPIKKEIQISQIKECLWKLSLKPSVASHKIAVIDEAQCLNKEAQNSLLKTLEEPKGKTLIFLIAEYQEKLLPTILSRCQTLKFHSVPEKEIERYLKTRNIAPAEISQILENSGGRPGRVMDFLSEPEKLKAQSRITSDLEKILDSDLSFRFQAVKNLAAEPQNLKDILDAWLRYFRNALISAAGGKALGGYSVPKLKKVLDEIERTNFLLSNTNANPRLALEILMMEI